MGKQDWFYVSISMVLGALILGAIIWSLFFLVKVLSDALYAERNSHVQMDVRFNLEEARKLKL